MARHKEITYTDERIMKFDRSGGELYDESKGRRVVQQANKGRSNTKTSNTEKNGEP
ncbi:unnamed protein product [Arabidopsis lyrata]|uniref:Predicted protein n=1 Tax=Arabidopsis lyrata subsp. lyrata TaxID=81972 RepID=D7MJ30_ARALL|nr:predicted protein [Arabidopsis lyrata subsp. lyrata]CAH8277707.1 unnamed protein product [Arabidopsis lyrata]